MVGGQVNPITRILIDNNKNNNNNNNNDNNNSCILLLLLAYSGFKTNTSDGTNSKN